MDELFKMDELDLLDEIQDRYEKSLENLDLMRTDLPLEFFNYE